MRVHATYVNPATNSLLECNTTSGSVSPCDLWQVIAYDIAAIGNCFLDPIILPVSRPLFPSFCQLSSTTSTPWSPVLTWQRSRPDTEYGRQYQLSLLDQWPLACWTHRATCAERFNWQITPSLCGNICVASRLRLSSRFLERPLMDTSLTLLQNPSRILFRQCRNDLSDLPCLMILISSYRCGRTFLQREDPNMGLPSWRGPGTDGSWRNSPTQINCFSPKGFIHYPSSANAWWM